MSSSGRKKDRTEKEDFKRALIEMMRAWRDGLNLSLLQEVPGIPQETWDNEDVVCFPSDLR